MGFFHGWDYEANFSYGVGSVIFAFGPGAKPFRSLSHSL